MQNSLDSPGISAESKINESYCKYVFKSVKGTITIFSFTAIFHFEFQ